MGPTLSIPHGKSMLGEDCSLWLEGSAAGVEGVSGFLAEGSQPSPSECGGMVSECVRSHPLVCLLRFEVTAFVTDIVPIRAACLLQRSPEFFKKAVPLPGASLALVGCNTGSCTLVGLFTWAQWAGELYLIPGRRIGLVSFLGLWQWAGGLYLIPGRRIGLASFLGLWRARWFYSCWFPLGTCTDSPGDPSRRQADRHEAQTFDRYVI